MIGAVVDVLTNMLFCYIVLNVRTPTNRLDTSTLTTHSGQTLGDLWSEPLDVLYARLVAVKRYEGRYKRELYPRHAIVSKIRVVCVVESIRLLSWLPKRYRRLQAAVALICFIRLMDHVIDPNDVIPPYEGTREEHFEQYARLVKALPDITAVADEPAYPELALFIYAYRTCQEELGFDPTPELVSIWRKYEPDARRTLTGVLFTDQTTLELAQDSYMECVALTMQVMGVPPTVATAAAKLYSKSLFEGDMLADFLFDLLDGNLQVTEMELIDAGIDIEQLLACESYEELAELDGFVQWFHTRALANEARWQQARPQVEALLLPNFKSWVMRKLMQRKLHKLHRTLRKDRRRFERHIKPKQPVPTPSQAETILYSERR